MKLTFAMWVALIPLLCQATGVSLCAHLAIGHGHGHDDGKLFLAGAMLASGKVIPYDSAPSPCPHDDRKGHKDCPACQMLSTLAATVTTPLSLPHVGCAPEVVVIHQNEPAPLPAWQEQSPPRAPPHAAA